MPEDGFYRAAGEGDSNAVPFPRPLLRCEYYFRCFDKHRLQKNHIAIGEWASPV